MYRLVKCWLGSSGKLELTPICRYFILQTPRIDSHPVCVGFLQITHATQLHIGADNLQHDSNKLVALFVGHIYRPVRAGFCLTSGWSPYFSITRNNTEKLIMKPQAPNTDVAETTSIKHAYAQSDARFEYFIRRIYSFTFVTL